MLRLTLFTIGMVGLVLLGLVILVSRVVALACQYRSQVIGWNDSFHK